MTTDYSDQYDPQFAEILCESYRPCRARDETDTQAKLAEDRFVAHYAAHDAESYRIERLGPNKHRTASALWSLDLKLQNMEGTR